MNIRAIKQDGSILNTANPLKADSTMFWYSDDSSLQIARVANHVFMVGKRKIGLRQTILCSLYFS